MNILHIYKDYFPVLGGIENHIKMLAEAQAARGHTVAVLATSLDRRTHVEMLNGVRVIFASRLFSISSTPISPALFALIRHETPDVAHLHFPYPLGELANCYFGRARRTVLTYHSDIIRQRYLRVLYAPLMHRMLAQVDRILPTSPNYIASSPVLTRWKSKCLVVPLGIDLARLTQNSQNGASVIAGQARQSTDNLGSDSPLHEMKPVVLFVGKLRYYKGLGYLLQAMREIPQARLVVVGSGPMEREWKALAQTLYIDDRVEFAGEVKDTELPGYYARADVFVLPASERSEAFGMVQLEAMAAGKPVICTEIGTGTSFVNIDGETGLVVPARDPGALAAAIQRLLDDSDLREKMGKAGQQRVRQEFTLDRMVTRVLSLYEELEEPGK